MLHAESTEIGTLQQSPRDGRRIVPAEIPSAAGGTAFTSRLTGASIRISMDGRGRWLDNVFIERLWRPLKYEDVYLKGYADGRERGPGSLWIGFYNGRRPHQALAGRTPMAVWREGVSGALFGNAVDMTLRLDDAAASPTCPPRQQHQQTPRVA